MITKDVAAMVTYSFSYADEIGWKKNGTYPQNAKKSLRNQLKDDLLVFLGYLYDEESSSIFEQIDFINNTLQIYITREKFLEFRENCCSDSNVLGHVPLSLQYFVRDDTSPYSRRSGYGISLSKYLVNTFNDVGCYFIAFEGISDLEADRLARYIAMMNNYLDEFGLLKNKPASDYYAPQSRESYGSRNPYGSKSSITRKPSRSSGSVAADILSSVLLGGSYRGRSAFGSRSYGRYSGSYEEEPYTSERADLDAMAMIYKYNMAHEDKGTNFDEGMLFSTPSGQVDRSMMIDNSGEAVPDENPVTPKNSNEPASKYKELEDMTGIKIHDANDTEDINGLMNELNSLIGLENVKMSLSNLINLVKVNKMRREMGLKTPDMSLHLVFSGNPGTGKTTVARLLAAIYHKLGVVSKGQIIEVDRAGLVEGYVGQTAQKTSKVIDSAMGGVLFIDEAYTLTSAEGNDFGQEAVDTLLKRMEDDRGDLIVIVAGYTDEMKDFIDSNPGLKSRFNKFIEFSDYASDELLRIFKLMCSNQDYVMTGDTEEYVKEHLQKLTQSGEENFANAREVRNYFERCLERQANRIINETVVDANTLTTLKLDDVKE